MKYLLIFAAFGFMGCSALDEFETIPVWKGQVHAAENKFHFDAGRKTVVVLADNNGTEIFDLMAPFYMFSLTGRANVLLLAKEKKPIAVMKGFFTLPHYSFSQFDSLHVKPDVVVIPNFSATDDGRQDPFILNWIRRQYADSAGILSVCAGSFTAGATGLYDGKPMTTHASEMEASRKLLPHPSWITNASYVRAGRLYSTAGVSNATEGTLAVIGQVFGADVMKEVMAGIKYPYGEIKTSHRSDRITGRDKLATLKKVLLHKDKNVGVLLTQGVDEFSLAAVLDSYHRTFPESLRTFMPGNSFVHSRFGLVFFPTGDAEDVNQLDEMHILSESSLTREEMVLINTTEKVYYSRDDSRYIYDITLERIRQEFGQGFQRVVKRLLDYN